MSTSPKDASLSPTRPGWTFSLRLLFGLFVVSALLLAGGAEWWKRELARAPALKRLRQFDGIVSFGYAPRDYWMQPYYSLESPEDRRPVDDDERVHVLRIWARNPGEAITDADAAKFAKLVELQQVVLEDTEITDAGLLQLAELPSLSMLGITSRKITPDGASRFRALRPDVSLELSSGELPNRSRQDLLPFAPNGQMYGK